MTKVGLFVSNRRSDHVVIAGAGIAGLAAAIALLTKGIGVTVLEKAPTPGGKMRQLDVEGQLIDGGPTVFTMRWVFDELLAPTGRALSDLVQLTPTRILARHGWTDGSQFDLFADRKRAIEAVGDFAGAAEARRFRAFLSHTREVYEAVGLPFMRATSTSLPAMMKTAGPSGALALMKAQPHKTMWQALAKYFKDPRLQQLFGRYATYYGSSPFHCPPNLVLIAHVEHEGVWLIEGGMHQLAASLSALIEEMGGTLRYGATVETVEVNQSRVSGVKLNGGEYIPAETVILNADSAAIAKGLLGQPIQRAVASSDPARRSLSAITTATVAKTDGFPLARHTVFFSDAYKAEFDAIFRDQRVPACPTTYICAQDRGDGAPETSTGTSPETSPETSLGRERLFFLINAPANGDSHVYDPKEVDQCLTQMHTLLNRCGLQISEMSTHPITTDPTGFDTLFPGTGGALYGQASHGWTSFFARPGPRTRIKGLYLAGGSVHPGSGVPTAALSGRNAAACVTADLASTYRSALMATRGGMLMG